MAMFKARVDSMNAHEGLAGSHPGYLTETFGWIMEEQGLTKDTIKGMNSEGRLVFHDKVQV